MAPEETPSRCARWTWSGPGDSYYIAVQYFDLQGGVAHLTLRVNGQPAEIRRSPEGLVSVRVPAGASEVKLKYYPPTGLAALFWLSLASIGVGAAFLGGISLTRPAARAQG